MGYRAKNLRFDIIGRIRGMGFGVAACVSGCSSQCRSRQAVRHRRRRSSRHDLPSGWVGIVPQITKQSCIITFMAYKHKTHGALLSGMLNDFGDQLALDHSAPHLFGHGSLLKVAPFTCRDRDIDRRRFAGDDLDRLHALLTEIDRSRVGRVNLNSRNRAVNLDLE